MKNVSFDFLPFSIAWEISLNFEDGDQAASLQNSEILKIAMFTGQSRAYFITVNKNSFIAHVDLQA